MSSSTLACLNIEQANFSQNAKCTAFSLVQIYLFDTRVTLPLHSCIGQLTLLLLSVWGLLLWFALSALGYQKTTRNTGSSEKCELVGIILTNVWKNTFQTTNQIMIRTMALPFIAVPIFRGMITAFYHFLGENDKWNRHLSRMPFWIPFNPRLNPNMCQSQIPNSRLSAGPKNTLYMKNTRNEESCDQLWSYHIFISYNSYQSTSMILLSTVISGWWFQPLHWMMKFPTVSGKITSIHVPVTTNQIIYG